MTKAKSKKSHAAKNQESRTRRKERRRKQRESLKEPVIVTFEKPTAKVIGENGNVFNIMGICARALKRAGYPEKAKEMFDRIQSEAKSYHESLGIMSEYVNME